MRLWDPIAQRLGPPLVILEFGSLQPCHQSEAHLIVVRHFLWRAPCVMGTHTHTLLHPHYPKQIFLHASRPSHMAPQSSSLWEQSDAHRHKSMEHMIRARLPVYLKYSLKVPSAVKHGAIALGPWQGMIDYLNTPKILSMDIIISMI